MKISNTAWVCFALAVAAPAVHARTWTDATGKYTIEADLIAFDDDQVILQRKSDGALGSVELGKLCSDDQAYCGGKEAADAAAGVIDAPQTWTLKSGLQVPGRLVDYVRREVTMQRRRGKVYVNDRQFDNLPDVYKKIAPKVVGYYEKNRVDDEKKLTSWLVRRKGQPVTYTVDGVILELPSGDEYAVPFFLFSEQDLEVLRPGWEEWLAAAGEYDSQQDRSFELQSLAAAYKQDSEQRQQIARLQLGMQAVEAGMTSFWEVTLYPGPGVPGPPLWVLSPGRDSRTAGQGALARNPGYTLGPVRRVSRR